FTLYIRVPDIRDIMNSFKSFHGHDVRGLTLYLLKNGTPYTCTHRLRNQISDGQAQMKHNIRKTRQLISRDVRIPCAKPQLLLVIPISVRRPWPCIVSTRANANITLASHNTHRLLEIDFFRSRNANQVFILSPQIRPCRPVREAPKNCACRPVRSSRVLQTATASRRSCSHGIPPIAPRRTGPREGKDGFGL